MHADRRPPPAATPPTPEQLAAAIVAIARDQDRAAFSCLFDYFAPRLKAYLLRLGEPPGRADDLAQDTLLAVWRKAAQYDPARAEPAAWIFTIARNQRIDSRRRQPYAEVTDDVLADQAGAEPPADSVIADRQRSQRLRQALAALPPDQAEVVRLSFFAELAHPAIAERLQLPLGTVKSRLRLAFGKIRQALGEDIA